MRRWREHGPLRASPGNGRRALARAAGLYYDARQSPKAVAVRGDSMSSSSAPNPAGPSPFVQITQIATGYMPAACLYVAAKLKIADRIAAGTKAVAELARTSGTNEDALYRVLRSLASINVFREDAPRTFGNTPLSERLRSDVPDSDYNAVIFLGNPLHLRIFAELMHSVETGGTGFKKVTGLEAFEYFRANPEEGRIFNAAMTSIAAGAIQPILDAYDFGETGTLADIGGGHGMLLSAILQRHRGLRGIVFDMAHVVEGAKPQLASLGLASRCEVVSGDFFQEVPAADSYIMKSIIHDWNDERSIVILKNCAKAMRGNGGKILVLDFVIAPGNQPDLGKWIDMEMLALAGGRERTEAEFAELFARAGLKLSRIVRSASPNCVIEAVKA
jgi:O-methyltransferase domain/Dimerisation domain